MDEVKYMVMSLDVWGNAEEGFEKNDWFNVGYIELPSTHSHGDIIGELFHKNYLSKQGRELAEVFDYNAMGEYLEVIDKNTARPLYDLKLVTE